MFRNQKVVCIDTSGWGNSNGRITFPKKGEIYSIREFCAWPLDGRPCIRLNEIKNEILRYVNADYMTFEHMFLISRFRPLITQIDDVKLFESLLNENKVENV